MIWGMRLLNDNGQFLGLNVYDLIGAICVLVVVAQLTTETVLDFLPLPAAAIALVSLIPVRMRYRRKILRDRALYILLRSGLNRRKIYMSRQAWRASAEVS